MDNLPFFPSPVTDFLFLLSPRTTQNLKNPFCIKIEEKFMDCVEAYGTHRARQSCAELTYDLIECANNISQKNRAKLILKERMKQYREGKLTKPFEEYPALDSFLSLPIA